MELDQLRYFIAVAANGSFTSAGEELNITQPALSRSIAKLELELGQPLFERQSRQLKLTDLGARLKSRAEQILLLVDDTLAELTDDGVQGRVRVGAIPTIAPYFLPPVMRRFRDNHPSAQIVAMEETTDKLLQRCAQGDVDLVISAAPVRGPYLEMEPLFEEELLVVLPSKHELTQQRTVRLAQLQKYPFVLLDETHCLSETISAVCRQRSFQPVTIEHASQLAMVAELVAMGHGVSLIPQMARAVDSSQQRVYRRVTHPIPKRQIVMVWNPYRFQSQLMQHFRECVRAVAASFHEDAG